MSNPVLCPCDWRRRTMVEYMAHIEAGECGVFDENGESREAAP